MIKGSKRAAFIIPGILLSFGILFQIIFDKFPLHFFEYPLNVITGAELLALIVLLYIFFKQNKIIVFLKSGHAALSSIALFTLITVLIAIIPQGKSEISIINELSLNSIPSTWYYAISLLYLLICLGFVTIKRLTPLSYKNIFFFINHFGLWLVLFSANLGHADKVSLNMIIPEGEKKWYAYDSDKSRNDLNFAIQLNEFKIENYSENTVNNNSTVKNYEAEITVLTNKNQQGYKANVLINKPVKINDYSVYLHSYIISKDNTKHAIFTIVKDPWLYASYAGFIMIFLGSILLLFERKEKLKTDK